MILLHQQCWIQRDPPGILQTKPPWIPGALPASAGDNWEQGNVGFGDGSGTWTTKSMSWTSGRSLISIKTNKTRIKKSIFILISSGMKRRKVQDLKSQGFPVGMSIPKTTQTLQSVQGEKESPC